MSSAWIRESIVPTDERPSQSAELGLHNLNSVREAALTLLREVESLRKLQMMKTDVSRDLHEEVQRFEIELIKQALQRTRGNQRRAARLHQQNGRWAPEHGVGDAAKYRAGKPVAPV